ncbi:MAG TPA: hypothetical protein VN688_00970 [Gemmataceae bacterium]|nr:hypothetical protein [Gemmataceae bacterium]
MASTLRILRLLTLATVLLAPLYAGLLLTGNEHQPGISAVAVWLKEQERAERLRNTGDMICESHEVMEAIIWDLIEGRLPLRKAAADLNAAMGSRVPNGPLFRVASPGQSAEESSLRWAIHCAEVRLKKDAREAEVLHRLHAELQDYLSEKSNPSAPPHSLPIALADDKAY